MNVYYYITLKSQRMNVCSVGQHGFVGSGNIHWHVGICVIHRASGIYNMYVSECYEAPPTYPRQKVGMIANIFFGRNTTCSHTHGVIGICPLCNWIWPNRSVPYAPSHSNILLQYCNGKYYPKARSTQTVNPPPNWNYSITNIPSAGKVLHTGFFTFADTSAILLGWESLRQLTSYILLYYTLCLQIHICT